MLQFQFNTLFFSSKTETRWRKHDKTMTFLWVVNDTPAWFYALEIPKGQAIEKIKQRKQKAFISVVTRARTCLARTFNVWLQRHRDWKECRRRAMHLLNQMCYGIGYFMLYNPEPCSDYIIVVLHFSDRDRSRKIFFLSSRLTVRLLIAIHWLFS